MYVRSSFFLQAPKKASAKCIELSFSLWENDPESGVFYLPKSNPPIIEMKIKLQKLI